MKKYTGMPANNNKDFGFLANLKENLWYQEKIPSSVMV